MNTLFYVAGAVAVAATVMTITRLNAVHALLYLIVSLLAVAVVFYTMGAPFVAALEVVIYAGAIMVLFVFVVMMLNLGERAVAAERTLLTPGIWAGPAMLAAILFAEMAWIATRSSEPGAAIQGMIAPKQVGMALYGPYLLGVELASMLLLAGLVGAYHLGWRPPAKPEEQGARFDAGRTAVGGDFVRSGADRPPGAQERGVYPDVH
jgi:NADH-quinone oxidoreductase subunit J